jgi:hypothetical protein
MAEMTGRACCAIELLGQYVDVAVERWQAFHWRGGAPRVRWPKLCGGLAANKANGAKLGNSRNMLLQVRTAEVPRWQQPTSWRQACCLIVDAIRAAGATSLEAISRALNDRGVRPARGSRWHASAVSNMIARSRRFAEVR